MDPAKALSRIENSLRIAIRERLPKWQSLLDSEAAEKLNNKATEEAKRRDGTVASADLLDYTETYQLTGLILKQWDQGSFKDVFDDLARTKVFLGVVEDYRNAVAHGRDLLAYEADLLSGVAGQLRNQVALYRSSATTRARYYPLIERAEDSFGRPGADPKSTNTIPNQAMRFDVGDVYTVKASAISAGRDFEIRWTLDVKPYADPALGAVGGEVYASGDDVEISYTFTEANVREYMYVRLLLSTTSKHHRNQTHHYDDAVYWPVSINPPDDE